MRKLETISGRRGQQLRQGSEEREGDLMEEEEKGEEGGEKE